MARVSPAPVRTAYQWWRLERRATTADHVVLGARERSRRGWAGAIGGVASLGACLRDHGAALHVDVRSAEAQQSSQSVTDEVAGRRAEPARAPRLPLPLEPEPHADYWCRATRPPPPAGAHAPVGSSARARPPWRSARTLVCNTKIFSRPWTWRGGHHRRLRVAFSIYLSLFSVDQMVAASPRLPFSANKITHARANVSHLSHHSGKILHGELVEFRQNLSLDLYYYVLPCSCT